MSILDRPEGVHGPVELALGDAAPTQNFLCMLMLQQVQAVKEDEGLCTSVSSTKRSLPF